MQAAPAVGQAPVQMQAAPTAVPVPAQTVTDTPAQQVPPEDATACDTSAAETRSAGEADATERLVQWVLRMLIADLRAEWDKGLPTDPLVFIPLLLLCAGSLFLCRVIKYVDEWNSLLEQSLTLLEERARQAAQAEGSAHRSSTAMIDYYQQVAKASRQEAVGMLEHYKELAGSTAVVPSTPSIEKSRSTPASMNGSSTAFGSTPEPKLSAEMLSQNMLRQNWSSPLTTPEGRAEARRIAAEITGTELLEEPTEDQIGRAMSGLCGATYKLSIEESEAQLEKMELRITPWAIRMAFKKVGVTLGFEAGGTQKIIFSTNIAGGMIKKSSTIEFGSSAEPMSESTPFRIVAGLSFLTTDLQPVMLSYNYNGPDMKNMATPHHKGVMEFPKPGSAPPETLFAKEWTLFDPASKQAPLVSSMVLKRQ